MFVAPLAIANPSVACRAPARNDRRTRDAAARPGNAGVAASPASRMLVAWLASGVAALACLPAARGSAAFGASLPYWLVIAPLIDLAWLGRARLLRHLRRPRPPRPVGVARYRRARAPNRRLARCVYPRAPSRAHADALRSAARACSADRSSST